MTPAVAPRIAVIGAGYWGRHLIRNFFELGVLQTVCDRHPERLAACVQASAGPDGRTPRCTGDWHDVLSDDDVTAVAIVLPPGQHVALARAALDAGKDVFVEKPFCHALDEGAALVAGAERGGRILMVGHLLRYHRAVQELQRRVAAGDFGTLHQITATRLNLGPVFTERSAMWNFAPHDISVVLALMGDRLPAQVVAHGVRRGAAEEDAVSIHLQFDEGPAVRIDSSWINPFKEQRLVVIGSRMLACFDDTRPWSEKLQLLPAPDPSIDGRHLPPAQRALQPVELPASEPLREECAAFVDACRTRRAPLTDGAEGLRVMRVLDAAQRSLDAGGDRMTLDAGSPSRPSIVRL